MQRVTNLGEKSVQQARDRNCAIKSEADFERWIFDALRRERARLQACRIDEVFVELGVDEISRRSGSDFLKHAVE